MAGEWIELRCHPSARSDAARGVRTLIHRSETALEASFHLEGDLSRISVPAQGPVRMGNELWRRTCFELFIAIPDQTAYHEYNFSPSGEWALYAFRAYRDGGVLHDESLRPQLSVRAADDWLELDAVIQLDRLSQAHRGAQLRIGLAAVIEARDGISYWALRHTGAKPDFHRVAGFAISLNPPPGGTRS